MRSVTAQTIIDRARLLADWKDQGGPVSTTDLLDQLSEAWGELHSLLVAADPARFEAEQVISADGTLAYALPADYYGTRKVYRVEGGDEYPIEPITIHDRHRYLNADGLSKAHGYYLVGGNIELPGNGSGQTYHHRYVTHAIEISSTSDTIDGVNGWERFLVLRLAIVLLDNEQSNADHLRGELQRYRAELEHMAADRRLGDVECIEDIYETRPVFDDDWGNDW